MIKFHIFRVKRFCAPFSEASVWASRASVALILIFIIIIVEIKMIRLSEK